MKSAPRRAAVHNVRDPYLRTIRLMSSPLDRFLYYIRERYLIRDRREQGVPRDRWTQDPILATYKFTNVRREWDRTSMWINTHWHRPNFHDPMAGMGAAVARFFGHPEALAAMEHPATARGWPSYVDRTTTRLRARMERGEQVFTGAYMVRGPVGRPGTAKAEFVLAEYLAPVATDNVLRFKHATAQALHDTLVQYHGWGHFMAQEVVLDCMQTHVLAKATDRATYAMPGPGALRGLGRLQSLGMKENGRPQMANATEAVEGMKQLWAIVKTRLGWRHPLYTALTVHDIEFNLCEFDKYERTLWNQSTPKARFTPHEE